MEYQTINPQTTSNAIERDCLGETLVQLSKIRVRGGNEKSPSSWLLFLMSIWFPMSVWEGFSKKLLEFPKDSKLEKMMILDVAWPGCSLRWVGSLYISPQCVRLFQCQDICDRKGPTPWFVLAIFWKNGTKTIQKPRPVPTPVFWGRDGFSSYWPFCSFCCGILQGSLPPKSHTCRIGPRVWGHPAPWFNKGSCGTSVPAISIAGWFLWKTGPFTYPPGN